MSTEKTEPEDVPQKDPQEDRYNTHFFSRPPKGSSAEEDTSGMGSRSNSSLLSASLEEGKTEIDFNSLQEIARGGQSTIFKANALTKLPSRGIFPRYERHVVVLKELRTPNPASFQKHQDLSAGMHSSAEHNMIKLIGVVANNGRKYAVVPMCETFLGQHIDNLRQTKATDPFLFLFMVNRVMIDVLNALEYMHDTKRTVHRDIKPDNISFHSEHGVFCVIDFDSAGGIGEGDFQGSPHFMHPSNIVSHPEGAQPFGDIYSLGYLLKLLINNQAYSAHQTDLKNPNIANYIYTKGMAYRAYQRTPKGRDALQIPHQNDIQSINSLDTLFAQINALAEVMVQLKPEHIPGASVLKPLFQSLESRIMALDNHPQHRLQDRVGNFVRTTLMGISEIKSLADTLDMLPIDGSRSPNL